MTSLRQSLGDVGVTEMVAAFACSERNATEVDPWAATRSLVDTAGVALAGRETAAVTSLRRWVQAEGGSGGATPWGGGPAVTPSTSALINGTAGHALDFDDACPSMPLHPSTVLWPALLAELPQVEDPATRLITALDVGNAVMRLLGEVLPMDVHYGAGWHSTATVGRIAAVAALASLHGLSVDRARHALGLVASMAAGSLANFGTGTKPVHAGLAARDAVTAVGLVRHGLDANPSQFEHPLGFLAQYGRPELEVLADVPDRLIHWRAEWMKDWSIKRYPSCYGTHRAVDAALGLRADLKLHTGEQVDTITVHSHPGGLRPLRDAPARTGTEAKFSMEYTTARAVSDGALGLGAFTDAAATDAATVALARKVSVVGAVVPPGRADLAGAPYAHVRINMTDGRWAERLVLFTSGDARNPLDDSAIDTKFHECLRAGGWSTAESGRRLAALRDALDGTPQNLTEALAALCAAPQEA